MGFDDIKKEIRGFHLSSMIDVCLGILNEAQRKSLNSVPLWNILSIAKWAMLNTSNQVGLKRVSHDDIERILKAIDKLDYGCKVVDFKKRKDIKKSLRSIANQQFWFQESFHLHHTSRQYILYVKLASSINLNEKFRDNTGLSIEEFLRLISCANIYLERHKQLPESFYDGRLDRGFYELANERHSTESIKRFLELLFLITPSQVKELNKLKNDCLQLYETNIWSQSPFIVYHGQPQVLHKGILTQCAKHFIYDRMKKNGDQRFIAEFCKRVERYLTIGLEEAGIAYKNESVLKRKYRLSKVPDYMVEDRVLVDSKAIELNTFSAVTRDANSLEKDLKNSIIKGYIQFLSAAKVIDPKQEWFGLIVTYKNTFLGLGIDAWDEFLKPPIMEFVNENSMSISMLPPQNLFFIDIDLWDKLIQTTMDYNLTMTYVIKVVSEYNLGRDTPDTYMLFEQILSRSFKLNQVHLPYLINATHDLMR